ncbi:hypothetical protein TURU_086079 [Turdus rufiventris]|nr:hypothetical protein TURU_086079 [Turdus rufiventris]
MDMFQSPTPSSRRDKAEDSFSEDSFDEDAYLAALGTRPALPPEALDPSLVSVRELFGACTAPEPRQRPAAALIVQALQGNQRP